MYQVLYRKWRPQVFADVAGQQHVTKTLLHELQAGRLAHAYLFTGSRGTGKTTCAKILAKAVNCLSPVDGDPCNACDNCRGIDSGAILDVIEIDAASNNGVDNVRDLREEANFTPAAAKYRVYIIDEVHMLSMGAFNALLKTLEEPPEHVIFILATTEVHKLPATILSRCQRFDFHRIPPEDIAARLKYVAEQEQLPLDDEAAFLIARLADGALRDALSILDRCAGRGDAVTAQLVSETTGMAGRDYLYALSGAAARQDAGQAVMTLNDLHNSSCDMSTLANELLSHFRNMMIVKTTPNPQPLIVCTADELARAREEAEKFTLEQILFYLDLLQRSLENIRRGADRRVEIEMALIQMCSPGLSNGVSSLAGRVSELEKKLRAGLSVSPTAPTPAAQVPAFVPDTPQAVQKPPAMPPVAPQATPPRPPEEKTPPPAGQAEQPDTAQQSGDAPFTQWPEVLDELNNLDKPLKSLLMGSSAFTRGIHVLIRSSNPVLAKLIKQGGHASSLNEAIRRVTGQDYKAAVYNSPVKQEEQQKDPLSGLVEKMDDAGIQYTVE